VTSLIAHRRTFQPTARRTSALYVGAGWRTEAVAALQGVLKTLSHYAEEVASLSPLE